MGTLALPFTTVRVKTFQIPSPTPRQPSWTASKRKWRSLQMRLLRQSQGLLTWKSSKLKMKLKLKSLKSKSGMFRRRCKLWNLSLMCAQKTCSTRQSSLKRWKKASNAEGEVSGLRSRLILLQENNEKLEERLCKATLELAGACKRADSAVKKRIELENEVSSNEEAIDNLDKQLEESKFNLSASESKYDDISRKLATMESDAARAAERADAAEKKIADIEEELRVVGQNLQTLEVGEEKTIKREENYQVEILDLRQKLKASEYRGEQAEMNIQRLNVRIDQVEEDLLAEKMKIKKVSDELNQVFDDMLSMGS